MFPSSSLCRRAVCAAALCGALAVVAATPAETIAARRAFRADVAAHPEKVSTFLQNADPEIRREALVMYFQEVQAKTFPELQAALKDPEPQVRLAAASALAKLALSDPAAAKALETAVNDADPQVRKLAVRASWPFHREVKLLRNDASWDHEISVVDTLRLDILPWKFQTDPGQTGHRKDWYKAACDVSAWKTVKCDYWETQGFAGYDGVAWYRVEFTMPPKPANTGKTEEICAAEVHFDAVDESAWVWLNDIYLGSHDIGLEGWNVPFDLDCSKEVRWGAKNVMVVRVLDRGQGGGIWKPVTVSVLK